MFVSHAHFHDDPAIADYRQSVRDTLRALHPVRQQSHKKQIINFQKFKNMITVGFWAFALAVVMGAAGFVAGWMMNKLM